MRQNISLKKTFNGLTPFVLFFLSGMSHADTLNLNLKCQGSGTKSATETTIKTNRNKDNHSKEIGTEQSMVKVAFSGTMYVKINDSMGQVKLPLGMLPPMQRDEASEWFPINDFKVSDTEFKGEVRINFLNKPDLTIDRTSGTIILANGLNDFSGECQKIDENTKPAF